MARQIFDASAKFHAPGELLTAAKATARHRGVTFSELVRSALRREVREAA
jgi:predicted DNA binding CopG/RHH family protein